ncbi:MAG: GGDEF domain-containing protein [Acholeplasmatales bacterium]|nr:GGDEF domain-containing protein [Acholeplasmatales bacterium]
MQYLYNYLDSLDDKDDYALVIFDIDDFKKINDTYGHIYGDYVIKEISNIAKNNSLNQFVARYGGEEFIIIIKLNNDFNKAYEITEDIRKRIDEYKFELNNVVTHITVSLGISKYQDGLRNDEWIKSADDKLYIAKKNGKNQTVI